MILAICVCAVKKSTRGRRQHVCSLWPLLCRVDMAERWQKAPMSWTEVLPYIIVCRYPDHEGIQQHCPAHPDNSLPGDH